MAPIERKILFVYAVPSGVVAAVKDYLHKLVRPETYPCALCALTYGPLGKRPAWDRFLCSLDVPFEFLHADELAQRHPAARWALPAVLEDRGGTLSEVLSRAEVESCHDVDELVARLGRALGAAAQISTEASAPVRS